MDFGLFRVDLENAFAGWNEEKAKVIQRQMQEQVKRDSVRLMATWKNMTSPKTNIS